MSVSELTTDSLGPPPWALLPADLQPILRPGTRALTEDLIAAIRVAVPSYDRPEDAGLEARLQAGVERALFQFVDLIGTDAELPEELRMLFDEFGRREAIDGRQLESLLAAYRLGARVSWRRITEVIEGQELGEAASPRVRPA